MTSAAREHIQHSAKWETVGPTYAPVGEDFVWASRTAGQRGMLVVDKVGVSPNNAATLPPLEL